MWAGRLSPVFRSNGRYPDLAHIVSGRLVHLVRKRRYQVTATIHRDRVLVASHRRRGLLDERILGCSAYSMQTTLMILAALVGTLAVLVVAGAIYQANRTWPDRRRSPPPGRPFRGDGASGD